MRKVLLTLALVMLAFPAYAADECKIHPMKAPKLSIFGMVLPIDGAHIRPATAIESIDQGNSESFTVPEGTDYLKITVSGDVWVNVSSDGASAVVDQDQFVPSGGTTWVTDIKDAGGVFRKIRAGDIVKCISDS